MMITAINTTTVYIIIICIIGVLYVASFERFFGDFWFVVVVWTNQGVNLIVFFLLCIRKVPREQKE